MMCLAVMDGREEFCKNEKVAFELAKNYITKYNPNMSVFVTDMNHRVISIIYRTYDGKFKVV